MLQIGRWIADVGSEQLKRQQPQYQPLPIHQYKSTTSISADTNVALINCCISRHHTTRLSISMIIRTCVRDVRAVQTDVGLHESALLRRCVQI